MRSDLKLYKNVFCKAQAVQRNVYKNLSHLTEKDTYSGPNWSSILTGVHYNKHNVTDNIFDGSLFDMFPTFLNYIEKNINSINRTLICKR